MVCSNTQEQEVTILQLCINIELEATHFWVPRRHIVCVCFSTWETLQTDVYANVNFDATTNLNNLLESNEKP